MDTVSLKIGDRELSTWTSYRISHDLYLGAGHFQLEVGRCDWTIPDAALCKIYVNGQLELTGIVDRVAASYDKRGERLTIEGRDIMGLVVDSFVEEFFDVKGLTLAALAQRLLSKFLVFNRKPIGGDGVVGGFKKRTKAPTKDCLMLYDIPQTIVKTEPGQSVFSVLKDYAMSRGLMFYCLPDGQFVFGKPKMLSEQVPFALTNRRDGQGNNIISGEYERDSSRRYQTVRVVGMQQGKDEFGMDAGKMLTSHTVTDASFPFHKAMVVKNNNDYQSPAMHARMLLERMKHEGTRLIYKTARHSQNGRNWTINELCRVQDQALNVGLNGTYLIYGRTFSMDKQQGQLTELRLGPPGVVA